jgi:hypothetical protein
MATKGDFYQLDIIPSTKLSPAYYKHQIEIKNGNYLVRAGRPIVLIERKTIVMKLKTVLLAGLASVSLSHVRFDHAVGHEGRHARVQSTQAHIAHDNVASRTILKTDH